MWLKEGMITVCYQINKINNDVEINLRKTKWNSGVKKYRKYECHYKGSHM